VPDEPVPDDAAGLRAANARLRAVVEAKDGQVAMLTAALDAALERDAERKIVVLTAAPDTEDETNFRLAVVSGVYDPAYG
jgi:hypothetical protein